MWPPLTKFALVESALVVQRLQLAQGSTLIDAIIAHLAQSSFDCSHCSKQRRLGVLLLRYFFRGFSLILCGANVIILRRTHLCTAFLPHYEFNTIVSVIRPFTTAKPFPHDSTKKICKDRMIMIVNGNGGVWSQQSFVYLSAMMSYLNPKRISITNIRSTSKNKQLGSPSKPPIKEQEPNLNFLNLPPSDPNPTPSKRLQRLPSNDSHRESAMRSQTGSDKGKKAKTAILQYFEEFMRDLRPQITEADNVKISTTIKNISSGIQDFTTFTQQFFKIYNYAFALSLQREENRQLVLPLKYKQAKKILLMEETPTADQKSSRNKRLIELGKQNEDLKKEVFRCKESIKDLEKRLVFLIEQFKSRKTVYLKEIQKLISIIETSIKGIPDLITVNKQLLNSAKNVSDNQLPLPKSDLKLMKKESEYNTLFYNYNSSDPAIEAPSIQRYKSEGKLRINP